MKTIPISKRKYHAIVDDDDYNKAIKYKWHIKKRDNRRTFYACTNIKKEKVLLHRFILGSKKHDNKIIDHINRNGLDCRKENLRIANNVINNMNRDLQRNNTSGYRGVCRRKKEKKWRAQIGYNNKMITIGYYKDIKDAAKAYNKRAKELFGEYAYLNKLN